MPTGPDQVATLAGRVARLRPRGATTLVGIDGGAGAGKSTLAAALAGALPGAAVVPVDDLCSPADDGTWRWADRATLRALVLDPLAAGLPARYRPYDWSLRARGPERTLAAGRVVLVEGVSALARDLADRYDLAIWVECPRPVRLARGLARDGEGARRQWLAWMAEEDRHFARDDTRRRADVLVDGGGMVPGVPLPAAGPGAR